MSQKQCEIDRINSGQPNPTPNDSTPIVDLVIEDFRRRKAFGLKKYGTPVQAHNGRDALQDAYEEILDTAIYLKQAIEERNENQS